MEVTLYSIRDGSAAEATLHDDDVEVGGQGRVFQATFAGKREYCVKALPDITPRAASGLVGALGKLAAYVDESVQRPDLPPNVRRSLINLQLYLPTHTGFHRLDGDSRHLLLFRRYATGKSLKAAFGSGKEKIPVATRYDITKRIIGHLTTLGLYGFVHLDPYPDNVFITLRGGKVVDVALIDLEGVGVLARDANGNYGKHTDSFAKQPTAFGKEGVWVLPPWYPAPAPTGGRAPRPWEDKFVAAAVWQLISLAIFVATGGYKPFQWLTQSAFLTVADADRRSRSPAENVRKALKEIDDQGTTELLAAIDGNEELLTKLMEWCEMGYKDERDLPTIKQAQNTISRLCRAQV